MNRIMYRATEDIGLEQLAEQFGTTASNISRLNNISGTVKKGMRILIDKQEGEYYIVQPFDTIKSISQKFAIDEEDIKEANAVQSVFIGQKIFLPRE